MCEVIEIQGVVYNMEHLENEVHLSRYSERYKRIVDIYFPTGAEIDEGHITEILSGLFLKRYTSSR